MDISGNKNNRREAGYKYGIKGKELWKGKGWMPYFWGEEVIGGTGTLMDPT